MGGRQKAESRRRAQGHRGPPPAKGVRALGRRDRRDFGQRARREPRAAQALRRSGLSRSASEGKSGRKPGNARGLAPARVSSPKLSHDQQSGSVGAAGRIMGASLGRRRRTRVLVITSEIELVRLIRSALETEGCLVGATAKADGPFDIVLVDLPELDLDQLRQAKRTHSDAHVIAICGGYREADCIAVLDLDADRPRSSLPPAGFSDARARRRVAALQRYRASSLLSTRIVCDRPVRPQGRHWERADRARPNSPAHPHASGASGEPCSDLRPHPR